MVLAVMVLVQALMVLAAVLLAAVFLAARPRVPVRQQCGAVPPASCLQLTALPLSDVRLYGHDKTAGLAVSPSLPSSCSPTAFTSLWPPDKERHSYWGVVINNVHLFLKIFETLSGLNNKS